MKDQKNSPGKRKSERGIFKRKRLIQRMYGWNESLKKNRMCVGFNGKDESYRDEVRATAGSN